MKSRTMVVALMVFSMIVLAASGQARADKSKTTAEPVLQDDNTGSFMVINVTTGEYKFHDCASSFVMGGFATVNITGCRVTVKDVSEERLVVADIDMCAGQARAYLVTETLDGLYGVSSPTRQYTIIDSDIRDSTTECKTPQK